MFRGDALATWYSGDVARGAMSNTLPSAAYASYPNDQRMAAAALTGAHSGLSPTNLGQFAGQDLATMGLPTQSQYAQGGGDIIISQVLEKKTLFATEKVYPSVLGPGGLAPIVRTQEQGMVVTKVSFEENLPETLPQRAVPHVSTMSITRRAATMRTLGNGIEMDYNLLAKPEGMMYLRLGIDCMNNGFIDAMLLTAYVTICSANDQYSAIWNSEINQLATNGSGLRVADVLRRDSDLLGFLQKHPHPFEALIDYIEGMQSKIAGAHSDALLIPPPIPKFAHTHSTYAEYFRRGNMAEAHNRANADTALTAIISGRYTLHIVDMYANTAEDLVRQFLSNVVVYGDFFVIDDTCTAQSKCTPFAKVYSSLADDYVKVSLLEAIDNCGRFGADGNLRNMFEEGLMASPIPAGTKISDSFSSDAGLPKQVFGQLPLDPETLNMIAYALYDKSKTTGVIPLTGLPTPAGAGGAAGAAGAGAATTVSTASRIGSPVGQYRDKVETGLLGRWSPAADGAPVLDPRTNNAWLVSKSAFPMIGNRMSDTPTEGINSALNLVANIEPIGTNEGSYAAVLAGLNLINRSTRGISVRDVDQNLQRYANHLIQNNILSAKHKIESTKIASDFAKTVNVISNFIDETTAQGLFEADASDEFSRNAADISQSVNAGIASSAESQPIGAETQLIGARATAPYAFARTLPDVVSAELGRFLNAYITKPNIQALVANGIPLPFAVVCMRPFIQLRTYSIVACAKGAQHVYMGRTSFTWNDNGVQRVWQGVGSMEIGGMVIDEKTIFHARNVYIGGILGGWTTKYRIGGPEAATADPTSGTLGDMLVLLEPRTSPALTETISTPYGNFKDVPALAGANLCSDDSQDCLVNGQWARHYYNIMLNTEPGLYDKANAYDLRSQATYICWRAGSFNSAGEYTLPAGAFSNFAGYGTNMDSAFRTNQLPRGLAGTPMQARSIVGF